MRYPSAIRRENDVLRRELGTEHDRARFQWTWSEELLQPMLLIDSDHQPIFDYVCRCGVNQRVHAAGCSLTTRRQRWEMRKIAPDLHDQWVLCRWVPTEASQEDWEASFAGLPYPENGFLVPVGDARKCLAISPGQIPLRQTTELCIARLKEHFAKRVAEYDREFYDRADRRSKDQHDNLVAQCKDAFPVGMGKPGEKNDVSYGGLPDVESPLLRKDPNAIANTAA